VVATWVVVENLSKRSVAAIKFGAKNLN
jgi:hypothetical protein